MGVRVADGVADRLVEDIGGFFLQVQVGPASADLARQALGQAAEEIATLDAGWESAIGLGPGDVNTPNHVSEVGDSPIGPYVYIDAKHIPHEVVRRYPQIVADHLTRAGVTDALVTAPLVGGPLDVLLTLPGAVILHARPSGPGRLPAGWLAEAVAWVQDRAAGAALLLGTGPVQLSTTSEQAAAVLDTCNRSGSAWLIASGDLHGWAVAGHGAYQLGAELVLAAGGPEVDDIGLAALAEELRALVRRLAREVAYAFIAFEPSFRDLLAGPHQAEEDQAGQDPVSTARLAGTQVVDAYWYQVLSPGHLRGLGEPPADAQPLPGGRMELTLGDAGDWVAGGARARAFRASARRRLDRILLGRTDAGRIP